MEAHIIFQQVQKMRPSCFSVEEQCCYRAEKMMLRQFMLLKQRGQVPRYLSVRDMKTWLLRGRSFLEEFLETNESTGERDLFMAELAWTTARHFCLAQMEEELLEELNKEKQLSQLLSREVTLEGLEMFVSVVHPAAEEDVKTFLPSMYGKLLRIFGGIQINSGPLSEGDTKPAELLELEQSAASLVPEVVDIALKFLLEEPELKDKCKLASAEIGKLLTNSAAPCLSQFGSVSRTVVLSVCTRAARSIVKAIFERFDQRSKSFHQMDYDESDFSAGYGAIIAIQEMVKEKYLRLFASEEQEGALLEKREVSPQVHENMATAPNDVTEDTVLVKSGTSVAVFVADEPEELQQEDVKESHTEETLVQDTAIQNMDHGVRTDTSTHSHAGLWSSERLEDQLLEKQETSQGVPGDEELAIMQYHLTEVSSSVNLQANVAVNIIEEIQVLQREEEKQKSLVQHCDMKRKKGVRTFFRGVWKMMTCCFSVSTMD
ncbi:uncharacterized protein LOC123964167 [Micropterus dolomieu]|uniref:uncharacterized protein LOC123964167 n=1 Tax=Micropterus dolomieu TaxID=147949 RepID=UPI001E8E7182|nr:uncharacterized protein LOC123964167 [Micropterus dolomieu]